QLLSPEHFTVDGTLLEAWAGLKSFKAKGATSSPPDDPGNPTVDFHGERRSNATHASTTDPEARLARKGPGKEAKLAYQGHVLMENRNGRVVVHLRGGRLQSGAPSDPDPGGGGGMNANRGRPTPAGRRRTGRARPLSLHHIAVDEVRSPFNPRISASC